MRLSFGRTLFAGLAVILASAGTWVFGRSAGTTSPAATATLVLDTKHPGYMFEHGALGLSVDANELQTGHLSARDHKLVRLMRMLGSSVLRIGGTSVDVSWWTSRGEPAPAWATNTVTPASLRVLRGLIRATGWRVLLGVDLGHPDPVRAANEADAAQQILGPSLLGIEIGNEANDYGLANGNVMLRSSTYNVTDYLQEAQTYSNTIRSSAPGIAIFGPSFSQTRWLAKMGTSASLFATITQHYYPSNACPDNSSPNSALPPTGTELLSAEERDAENEILAALAQVRTATKHQTLIDETGTGPCHGDSAASQSFASALWAMDWSLRATSSGVVGLNFHGHFGVCGLDNQSPVCVPTATATAKMRVAPEPEYYGLLAASRLEGGRFIQTRLRTSASPLDLTTWATITSSGKITIAIDNFATDGPSESVLIPAGARHLVIEERLAASSVAAKTGVSLGGTHVTPAGRWRPSPTRLNTRGRSARVVVSPGSAVIVTLRKARARR